MATDNPRSKHRQASRRRPETPIIIGSDTELGNFITGLNHPPRRGTACLASRLLLREIPGIPGWGAGRGGSASGDLKHASVDDDGRPTSRGGSGRNEDRSDFDPRDVGRKWLPSNGGCCYIDLDHLELCTPEVRTASQFVAAWHGMLRTARRAMQSAGEKLPEGVTVQVLVNNSDGQGNSYGGHLNFLTSRRTWNNIFCKKPHYLAWLASYQVSSIIFTGQGKVGAENDRPPIDYQLAQRADFFETVVGPQTTFRRPIVNSRDEPLCGWASDQWRPAHPSGHLARLHVIFYDSNLCHVANLLKVGVLQIILAMIEADQLDPGLIFDDLLKAVMRFSRDPSLRVRARTVSGRRLTAVEHQLRLLEAARRFYRRGGCDGRVPQAAKLIDIWDDTLRKLRAGDLDALVGRLDWVLKRHVLRRVIGQRPDLNWDSPEIKHLDHQYSSLDLSGGLYWHYERAGVVERVAEEAQIVKATHSPPHDTRAWTRARLLRLAGPRRVARVDWDSISFKSGTGLGWTCRKVELADPAAFTRAQMNDLVQPGQTLDELLGLLPVSPAPASQTATSTWTAAPAGRSNRPLLPGPQRAAGALKTARGPSSPTTPPQPQELEPEEGDEHGTPSAAAPPRT